MLFYAFFGTILGMVGFIGIMAIPRPVFKYIFLVILCIIARILFKEWIIIPWVLFGIMFLAFGTLLVNELLELIFVRIPGRKRVSPTPRHYIRFIFWKWEWWKNKKGLRFGGPF
jgi:hypothetical protein